MASLEAKLKAVEDVEIDGTGRFKYILIRVYADEKSKYIVRGHKWAEYHGIIIFYFFISRVYGETDGQARRVYEKLNGPIKKTFR